MVNETLIVFFLCCSYASTRNSMRPWLSVDQSEPPHDTFCFTWLKVPSVTIIMCIYMHLIHLVTLLNSQIVFLNLKWNYALVLLYLVLDICLYWHSLCAVPHEIMSILSQGSLKWDLIIGTVLSQSYPLLLTTKSNDLLSANQYGKPRQLPMCSRQYGPTKTWETLWTRQVGTRATLRYLLTFPG